MLKTSSFQDRSEKVNFFKPTDFEFLLQSWWSLNLLFPSAPSLTIIFVSQDFLNEACFTPDCVGKICGIKIFSSTGLVKYQVREFSGGFHVAVLMNQRNNVDRDLLCFQFGPDVSSRPQTPKKQKCPRWGCNISTDSDYWTAATVGLRYRRTMSHPVLKLANCF